MYITLGASKVVRSGFWSYTGSLLSSFLAFLFWIVASSYVLPSVIGSVAVIMALLNILMVLFSFGLPMGLRRFIGLGKGKNDYSLVSSYFLTTLLFLILINIPLMIFLFFSSISGMSFLNLTPFQLLFVAILLILNFWTPLFTSLFDSLLRTEISVLATLVGSTVRLLLVVGLLSMGFDFIGVILAYAFGSVGGIVLLFFAVKIVRRKDVTIRIKSNYLLEVGMAGMPNWIPGTLSILGQTIGVLSIYSVMSSNETGLYQMAFAIASVIYVLSITVQNLLLPVLSGMTEGRKRAITRAIRLSLALAAPLALVLALYPSLIISFLGPDYAPTSTLLTILVLGAAISPISSGYISYIYAIGAYTHVAIIGVVTTVGRITLYALFIPTLGAIGVAIAYVLGEAIMMAAIIPSANKIGYQHKWNHYAKILIFPGLIAITFKIFGIHLLFGIPILLLVTLLSYTRLGMVTKGDLLAISQAFLPSESIERIHSYFRPILRVLYGE